MAPDIKHSHKDAPTVFHRIFRWYLDYGMDCSSRRQAMKDLSELLDIPERTMEFWVRDRRPSHWKMVLSVLEDKYGPPPAEVKNPEAK